MKKKSLLSGQSCNLVGLPNLKFKSWMDSNGHIIPGQQSQINF